jgi:hypothetical protein
MLLGFKADSGDSNYVWNIVLSVFRHVRKTSESDYWRRHVCQSVRPSTLKNSASTERIFEKFRIWVCLFVFMALQPIVGVFLQPGSGI